MQIAMFKVPSKSRPSIRPLISSTFTEYVWQSWHQRKGGAKLLITSGILFDWSVVSEADPVMQWVL